MASLALGIGWDDKYIVYLQRSSISLESLKITDSTQQPLFN